MTAIASSLPTVHAHAPIRTWFGVGGGADRLCVASTVDDLRRCVESEPALRVIGDGANLLVDDDGVDGLVVDLNAGEFAATEFNANGAVRAGAGVRLPALINESVRRGLAGIESLAGIPASLGGAVIMNAGGRFGEIAEFIERVDVVTRHGDMRSLAREEIAFAYRHSGLNVIVTRVHLRLSPAADREALRARQLDVMRYKKQSQPLGASSAGCCFKNPVLPRDVDGVGLAGERVSAGLLIDRAGAKGLAVRGAEVSRVHGNFLVTRAGARARDVIDLMTVVERTVAERFDVRLEREIVVWERSS